MKTSRDPSKIYRLPEVLDLYGVSKPTLYRWIKKGKFPAPVLLGGDGTRAVGWHESTLTEHQGKLFGHEAAV